MFSLQRGVRVVRSSTYGVFNLPQEDYNSTYANWFAVVAKGRAFPTRGSTTHNKQRTQPWTIEFAWPA